MTGGQLETLLYQSVKALNPPISGGVYYQGTRPMQNDGNSAPKEDIIVKAIAGSGRQVNEGTCVVNAYIPDIVAASGTNYADKTRCDALELWLEDLPEQLTQMGDVHFEKAAMVVTIDDPAIKQHFVSLKMKFKFLEH